MHSYGHFSTCWNIAKMFTVRRMLRFIPARFRSGSVVVVFLVILTFQSMYLTRNTAPKRIALLARHPNETNGLCTDVHVVVTANGVYQRQRLSTLIKSILLYSRHAILHLHMLTDDVNKKRIMTLLSTWNLPQVVPHFYKDDGLVKDYNSVLELTGFLLRNRHSLEGVSKFVLVHSDVYFLGDVSVLWQNIQNILLDEMTAFLQSKSPDLSKEDLSNRVMLLNMEQFSQVLADLQPTCPNASLLFTKDPKDDTETRALISAVCRTPSGKWSRPIQTKAYTIPIIQTEPLLHIYSGDISPKMVEYDVVMLMETFDGDLFREITPPCIKRRQQTLIENTCDVYPAIAKLSRRTHTHYLINNYTAVFTNRLPEVSLVTQLMLNRVGHLERLLAAWDGPSHVSLYLTDGEVVTFRQMYERSEALRRANATYHIIYKRHKFYPINYVRNVAIRETTTPYYVMIDVDFAAQPELYQSISSHLRKLKPKEKKAFVIPVFETLLKQYALPLTKTQLVEDMDRNLIMPYHQIEGTWSKGHERTDYKKWRTSKETYQVDWEFGYEPYVVVPTSEFLYDESLVERMRDKLTYTVEIILKGYTLHVLPFDYLIHTPHQRSESYQYSDRMFLKCAAAIYKQRIKEMEEKYKRFASPILQILSMM